MPTPRHHRFEAFCLDTQTRELREGEGPAIALTAKAFDTLCLLIEHRHRVVSKDELLATVWPGRVVEENNLTQAISALRRAFGTNAGEHRYIVTVPGRGYRFVAELHEGEPELVAQPMPAIVSDAAAETTAQSPSAGRRMIAIGALVFVLGLFAAAAWRMREATPALQPPAQTALAVLPFQSLSNGPRDDLLGLGLAETLISRLGHSSALRVRALESAQRASSGGRDAVAAGRQLGAKYVLAGSTQRSGDQVRVNTRLLSVPDGATVWTDTFDARSEQIFTLQDRIASAVTSALALRPITLGADASSGCNGGDPTAYRAWLRAQYKLHRREPDTLAAFHQALEVDPTCARAYAGLAVTYLFMAHTDRDPHEVFPLAKATIAQALRLDPDSAEALTAQGRNQQLNEWDWAAAEASLRRAIAINPSLAEAHFGLAHLLIDTGHFDEGLAQARQARELDPLSPLINALEAGFLSAARQPDAASARIERALELDPDFWVALLVRGDLALDRGDVAAARSDLEKAAAHSQRTSQVLAMLAVADVAAGERGQAQAILRELQARATTSYVPATSLAAVHNALGDTNAALDQLEHAYQQRDIRMAFLKVDARWNNLRATPRFQTLAQRMGLAGGHAYGRF